MAKKRKKGFTLVEALVGIIIVTLIAAGGFFAFDVMRKQDVAITNDTTAANLMQMVMEDVKRVSRSYFDDLGPSASNCSFSNNYCHFEAADTISTQFPKFTPSLIVNNYVDSSGQNSTEMKQVNIRLDWTSNGRPQFLEGIVLVARPPDPLPGNILGRVFDKKNNTLISGATITVTDPVSGKTASVISDNDPDGDGVNYNFKDSYLDAGGYALTAQANGYSDYTATVGVNSNQPTRHDIPMDLLPVVPLTINIKDVSTNNLVPYWGASSNITVYENGSSIYSKNGVNTWTIDISFSSSQPRKFTVVTDVAWKSGYAYRIPAGCNITDPAVLLSKGTIMIGKGYSSAVLPAPQFGKNSATCGNLWKGSAASDVIEVRPTDTSKTFDIRLERVLTTVLTGSATDSGGQPFPNSANGIVKCSVPDYWDPANSDYLNPFFMAYPPYNASGTVDGPINNGTYTISNIPAFQDFLPNTTANYASCMTTWTARAGSCCNGPSTNVIAFHGFDPGPLNSSSPRNQNLVLGLVVATNCGDVIGSVKNLKTNAPLNGASIRFISDPNYPNNYIEKLSGVTGQFNYQCTTGVLGPPFSMYTQSYNAKFIMTGFYDRTANNNADSYYAAYAKPSVPSNATLTTWSPSSNPIGLWPIGYGTINVTVKALNDNALVSDIRVVLYGPQASVPIYPQPANPPPVAPSPSRTIITSGSGISSFTNSTETWPPVVNSQLSTTPTFYYIGIINVPMDPIVPAPPEPTPPCLVGSTAACNFKAVYSITNNATGLSVENGFPLKAGDILNITVILERK